MVQRALFSSATDEWGTPLHLFRALELEFAFTLDVCASAGNAKCHHFFDKLQDGLLQDWSDQVVFMNPPYGRTIGRRIQKAYEASQQGACCVCLVPARTETRWWHDYVMRGEIRFLRGRIQFVGGKHPAPFPSAIVIFRPAQHRLRTYAPAHH